MPSARVEMGYGRRAKDNAQGNRGSVCRMGWANISVTTVVPRVLTQPISRAAG